MASKSPTMCGCCGVRCALCQIVERPPSRQPPAPVIAGMRSARTTMCGRCGTCLPFPRGARSVCCPLCHAVTRVQRRRSGLQDFLQGLIYSLMSPPQPPATSFSEHWLPASYPRVAGSRKRALLVGISYNGTHYELKDTVKDVEGMRSVLCDKLGFNGESILVLTEEWGPDPYRVPTIQNLRLAMRWLVHGCDTGDAMSLLFYFSGHSVDGALCPLDFDGGVKIPDYEINDTIVRPLGPGVKLHAIVDTCNNGTLAVDVLVLPYLCRIYRTGYWKWENQDRQPETTNRTNGGLAISISGRKDSPFPDILRRSASVTIGAVTNNFIKAVHSEPGATYARLINTIQADIHPEPELRATETFDIYRKPFLL